MNFTITIYSYDRAQVFKNDFVRLNGKFLRFVRSSGNHKTVSFDVKEGDQFDARASKYREGVTRWDAVSCQSWCAFSVSGGKLLAFDYDGKNVEIPAWINASEINIAPVTSN